MKSNALLKILSSLPIILIALYFIPFLGICLILLKYFMSNSNKRVSTPISLFMIGIIILIPKVFEWVFGIIKLDKTIIPYFNDIVTSEIYNLKIINYSKFLITIGIIFFILHFVFKSLFDKIQSYFKKYISTQQQRREEITKKNDMIIKEKQEIAKNSHVVFCSNCGADNILTTTTGRCKYCRSELGAKK